MRIEFTIKLAPVTKKNHSQIIKNPKTGQLMVLPSKQYKQYEKDARWFIPSIETIKERVTVEAHFYMPTRHRVDLVNLEQALLDILVKYGVLEDDNSNIVYSMDGSRVHYDKENPRTEVALIYESGNTDS